MSRPCVNWNARSPCSNVATGDDEVGVNQRRGSRPVAGQEAIKLIGSLSDRRLHGGPGRVRAGVVGPER